MAKKAKKNSDALGTIVTIVSIATLLLSYGYLSKQINILVQVVLLLILLFFFNFFLFARKETTNLHTAVWMFEMLFVFLSLFINFRYFSFLKKGIIPFWQIALAVGIAAGVAATAFMCKHTRFWGRIGCFALSFFLVAFTVEMMIANLNYALDFSKPTKTIITIEDKDFDYNRRSPNSYEFEFTIDGREFDIEVPSSVYDEYDVGDIYELIVYNGAFDEAFYMSNDVT